MTIGQVLVQVRNLYPGTQPDTDRSPGMCSLFARVRIVAIYDIVIGILALTGASSVPSSFPGHPGGNFAFAIITLVAGILLFIGIKKKSRGLIMAWLVITIMLAVLAVVAVAYFIYFLAVMGQDAPVSSEDESKNDKLRILVGVTTGFILLHLVITGACVVAVVQFKKTGLQGNNVTSVKRRETEFAKMVEPGSSEQQL